MPEDPTEQPDLDPTPTVRRRVRRVVHGRGASITEVEAPQRARVRSTAEDTGRPVAPGADAAAGDAAAGDTAAGDAEDAAAELAAEAVLLDAHGQVIDPAAARGTAPVPVDVDPEAALVLAASVRDYLIGVDREGPDEESTLRRRSRLRDALAAFEARLVPRG